MKTETAMQELEDSIQNLSSLTDTNKFVLKSLMCNFKIKEKHQIIDAYIEGINEPIENPIKQAEQYYNETFKD